MRVKKSSINPYGLFVILISIYMFTSITYNMWPISSPNRIVGFLTFFDVILMFIASRRKKRIQFLLMGMSCVLVLFSFIVSRDYSRNLSDGVCWLTTMFLFSILVDKNSITLLYRELIRHRTFIAFLTALCIIIITVGLFDNRCYTSTWNGRYFSGYCLSPHMLSSTACLVMAYYLFLLNGKKVRVYHFFGFLPMIIAIFSSGARVFLIPLVLMIALYSWFYIKSPQIKVLLTVLAVIGGVIAFSALGMKDKFLSVSSNNYISDSVLGRITSGRSDFWLVDLYAYSKYSFVYKLLGRGFDEIYRINKTMVGHEFWAHNDLIDLLLSVGLVGVTLYIFEIISFFRRVWKIINRFIIKSFLVIYILFPMLINGFFLYQHYLYSTFILILVVCEIESRFALRNEEKPELDAS